MPSIHSATSMFGPRAADLSLSFITVTSLLILSAAWFIHRYFITFYFGPYSKIKGPPRHDLLYGSLGALFMQGDPAVTILEWTKKYGKIYRIASAFGRTRLVIADEKALTYILLQNSYNYIKPAVVRRELELIVGKGILTAEGDQHKVQKKLLAPAFTQPRINDFMDIFLEKADALITLIKSEFETEQTNRLKLDLGSHFSKYTLDVIGKAGFGYEFKSLEGDGDEFAQSIGTLLKGSPAQDTYVRLFLMWVLGNFPGILKYIPDERVRRAQDALSIMSSKSLQIFEEKKDSARDSDKKDLLSLLVKANQYADAKTKVSDEEMLAQTTTFLFAGHETTATALHWASLHLAENPACQDKFREEALAAQKKCEAEGRSIGAEELAALPYLDGVTREILRLSPPVGGTVREAVEDDVVPLGEPITLRSGEKLYELHIKKGDIINIGISPTNLNPLYGPDVDKFRPERWLSKMDPKLVESTKGMLYSHGMTFIAGSRGCIGYRLAIVELKVALYAVITKFKFHLLDDMPKIVGRNSIVTRPYIEGRYDQSRLPLLIEML